MSVIVNCESSAENKKGNGTNTTCTSGEYSLKLEGPKKFGRDEKNMTPPQAMLCALAACKCITARVIAEQNNINLNDIKVTCTSSHDEGRFFGEDVTPGFKEIKSVYEISADNTREELINFIKIVDDTCPLGGTLNNQPIMTSSLK